MQSLATWFSTADRESLAALAIDAVIKSTVLLLMAATIAGLMRRSSAAVRHRTWCLTFAGLLVLPLLSYALPAWRIPVLPPAEQPAPPAAAVVAIEMPAVPAEPPASIGDVSHDLDRFPGDAVRNWPADLESQGLAVPDAVTPVVDSTFSVAEPEPAITVAEPQPERPLVTEQSVLALWMIGSGVVLFPLLVGLVHSAWLGMRARQVTDGTWTGLLDELRGRLHLQRRVKLLELTRPVIPMTWGVLRPVVIVPQAAQRWPERLRRFVLLHELAHVKRWDVPFQLLGRIACAVYWFHPLAWYALRRLRVERELACDDCVVTTGERPSDYAEQLLQIVRTCRPAGIASVGVAMARTSHLEGRIRAMFDKARSHVPLSARAARVLSIAAALLVTTVAVVRPAAREAEPVEPAVVADDPASAELPEAAEGNDVAAALDLVAQPEPSRQICRFRGIVRDESGKPIAGAKLEVLPNPLSHASGDGVQALTLGTTADDGRFDAEFEPDDFYGTAGEMLQVTAHGFGPAWLQADEAKLSENLEIQLTADTVPIEGQILDLEGNPVAGAQISVERIEIPRGDNLDQYLESVKADGGSNFQFATTVFKQKVIAPVTTDPQGRFRMTGIGRDRIVDLELQGKGLHQARMRVMTRAGEKVSPLDQEQSARGQRFGEAPVYGATFSYLAQPSRLIKGIVVDAETKAPLSGINIGSLESGASATSSGDGRFVLDGCVKADEYRLLASAPAGIPYMQGSQRVVDAAGLKPIEITFEMTRGVTVSGTVTDKDTGKPVAARVGYWPAYPNPHLRPGIGGMEANAVGAFSNAETNREGQFSLPVLPGPGFLCINANDREAYESASVDAAAFFRERDVKYFSLVDTSNLTEPILITAHSDASSGAMPQRQFQAIEPLNIDAAGVQEPRSIHLVRKDVKQANATTDLTAATTIAQAATQPAASDPAKSDKEQLVRGTVVDPTGQPVAGATIRVVRVKRSRWAGAPVDTTVLDTLTTSPDGRFEIPGAQSLVGNHQNGPYWEWTEIVATATGYGFGFHSLADASANEPIQIPLSPPQGLRGRIVDLEGRPIEGATLRLLSVAVGGTSDKINEWLDRVSKLPASLQRNILGRLPTIVEQTHFPRTGDAAAAAELFPTLQTDAEGRFELDGIGRDRVAILQLNGPGLAQAVVQVLTRPLEHSVRAAPISPIGETMTYHGAECTVVAAPGASATGVVRDVETREPIAGAQVILSALSGSKYVHDGYITTTTDNAGRYELKGLPLGKGNSIKVIPVNRPYLSSLISIALPEVRDQQPVVRDVELRKAVWATGRLYDETTGAPVQGTLHFTPLRDNEYVARYPQFDAPGLTYGLGNDWYYSTDADGRFRIPVTPGRGVLCAQVFGRTYSTGYGADKIAHLLPKYGKDGGEGVFPTLGLISPDFFHSLREINPQADAEEVTVDLPVIPGITQELVFVDPAGQPLSGVQFHGAQQRNDSRSTDTGRLIAVGLKEGETPSVLAWQHDRKLGIKFSFTATRNSAPQTIVLKPQVIVRGRLVNPQGDPLAEHTIETRGGGNNYFVHSIEGMGTDQTGTFTVGLYAGETYELLAHDDKYTVLVKSIVPNVGESIDLGDLVIDPKSQDFYEAKAKHPPIVTKAADAAAATTPASATPVAGTQLSQAKGGAAMPAKGRAMSAPRGGAGAPVVARAEPTTSKGVASNEVPQSITVRGQVLDPAGKPVAGASVRAQTPLWAMLKDLVPADWKPPITETKSSANGTFEVSFSTQPYGDLSRLNPQWAEIWKKTVVAASTPGFGPAWIAYDEIKQPDQPVTLKLVEDVPIQGRIVDLEGLPIAGEIITISDLHAAENEDLSPWLAGISAGEPPWTVWKKAPKTIDPQLVGLPETATSNAEGRIEIHGVGRERYFALTFQSEKVAWKNIRVVTRPMEPTKAVISTPPFDAVEPVFGARFTFAATPARVITGIVRDSGTGAPLPGVAVESYKLVDYPYSNHRVLKTVTDADGRFRLFGMPKGDGNKLLVLPSDDQSYFMHEVDVSNPDGLAPVDVNIELHRGIWITGRVTDAATGEPVHARLHYLPYRTNTFALALPEFDKDGNVDGDQMRYQTKPDGTYRLVGLPGPAIIGAESVLKDYPMGQGYAEMPGPKEDGRDYLFTYHNPINPSPKWPTAMTCIDPSVGAETVTVDFRFETGSKVALRLVDPDGQSLNGADVTGLLPRFGWTEAIAGADCEAINLGADEERTMLFEHKSRGLGWVQRIKASDAAAQLVVIKLQPVATVTGRLLTATGDPITGMEVEARPLPSGDFARELPHVTTQQDGRFSYRLLPGAKYLLMGRGGGLQIADISRELAIEPGQSLDLGDLRINSDGKVVEKPTAAAKMPARPLAAAGTTSPAKVGESAASDSEHSSFYSGQVRDAAGQPLSGATTWLAINSGAEEREPLLKEVATSDKNGRFQFTLDAELQRAIGDAASSWWVGSLLAVAPGHGFDWMPLGVFQDGGAQDSERDEMKAHLLKAVGKDRLESRLLVLRRADRPVRGQLLDLEGRPLANVAVRVEAVSQPDVRLLLQALQEKSKQRYYDAVNATGAAGSITREHAHRLYPPVTTDASGRFELTGIGDDQLASLTIHGAGVESQVINVIGRTMSPASLPHLDSYPGGAKDVFYGRDFSHAVGPSVPIVGVVKEADSGAPVPNTLIYVERLFAEGTSGAEGQLRLDTQHIRTTTDAEGRYRLDGLPPGKGHVLIAKPPLSEPLLMAQQSVSLNAPGGSAQTVDIRIKRTFWIEGRVTDKHSGAAVPAYVDYLALESNPHTLDKHGLQQAFEIHRYRTDKEGRFRVPGLPGPGIAMVLAIGGRGYPREVGAETVPGYDKDSRYILTNPVGYPLGNWNLIKPIDPPVDAASFTCDFELDGGQEAVGRVVGPDGAALSNFGALGEVVNVPFWKQHADGQFAVQGYDGVGPRLLFFKNVEETLVGKLRVEGAATPELVVTLEPAVRVTGRLIAQETGLPAERYSLDCESSSLGDFRIDDVYTGDDGRFEVKGLMAGVTYKISTANSMRFSTGKNDFTIDVTKAKPGDVVDLGDVRGGTKERMP